MQSEIRHLILPIFANNKAILYNSMCNMLTLSDKSGDPGLLHDRMNYLEEHTPAAATLS